MNTRWNMEEARQLITELHGKEQLELANPSLNSVVERRDHANVHWHNARNVLATFRRLARTKPLFISALDEKTSPKYRWNERKAQASATAIIQSLHAIPDIYAHAIYYALGLNLGSKAFKDEKYIGASYVREKLDDSDLVKLRDLFSSLFEGGEFKHVAAMSNRSKHRTVVRVGVIENYTGVGDRIYFQFDAFEHAAVQYPAVGVREFSEREFNRCSKLIVDIGNELNAVLKARLAAKTTKAAGTP